MTCLEVTLPTVGRCLGRGGQVTSQGSPGTRMPHSNTAGGGEPINIQGTPGQSGWLCSGCSNTQGAQGIQGPAAQVTVMGGWGNASQQQGNLMHQDQRDWSLRPRVSHGGWCAAGVQVMLAPRMIPGSQGLERAWQQFQTQEDWGKLEGVHSSARPLIPKSVAVELRQTSSWVASDGPYIYTNTLLWLGMAQEPPGWETWRAQCSRWRDWGKLGGAPGPQEPGMWHDHEFQGQVSSRIIPILSGVYFSVGN